MEPDQRVQLPHDALLWQYSIRLGDYPELFLHHARVHHEVTLGYWANRYEVTLFLSGLFSSLRLWSNLL
jgi:hypothetical protein